jgi:hypothetical protein
VSNVSLVNSTVNGTNGTSAADDEGSVSFDGLTGTASFDAVTVSGGLEDNIVVTNTGGTLDMDVTNSTIGLNSNLFGNDGVLVETQGSSVLIFDVTGTSFLGARGDLIQVNALGTSSQTIVIRDNTFNNTHPASVGGGVTISGGSLTSSVAVDYTIEGSTPSLQTFNGAISSAITVNYVNGGGTATGTISNNKIGTSGVAGSGSSTGNGIAVGTQKALVHTVTIDGNDIDGVNGFAGIDLSADATSTLNATVTNNTMDEFGGFAFAGLNALVGGSGSGTAHMCAEISGNSISNAVAFGFSIFLDQLAGGGSWNFPGYAGPATPGPSPNPLDALLAAQNTIGAGAQDSSVVSSVAGGGTTCP